MKEDSIKKATRGKDLSEFVQKIENGKRRVLKGIIGCYKTNVIIIIIIIKALVCVLSLIHI